MLDRHQTFQGVRHARPVPRNPPQPKRRRSSPGSASPTSPSDGDLIARSPITGGELARLRAHTAGAGRRDRRRRAGRLPHLAHRAGAGARRARPRARRTAARAQGRSRRARLDRGGQDPLRGARRGAGDDRHLRPRGRPVPPAARAHDRLRAARAPDDGAVAPARGRRRDQRLQLPGGGVVVERRARVRLRRRGGVEAVGEDAAHRARLPGAARGGGPPGRRAGRDLRRSSSAPPRSARPSSTTRGSRCVSATGSTRMGRAVAPRVAGRFGKLLLELGGNNAAIVAPSADLDLTVRGIVFSAAGTAGQRCTSLRRVIAHSSVVDELVERIARGLRDAADRLAARRRHARRPARRRGRLRRVRRGAGEGAGQRRHAAWPAASGCSPTRRPTPTTCSRRWCGCRRSPTSCRPRRSRRSSTC